jgi:uncharacterized protein YjbI with pentapeptide repeats
MDLKSIFGEVIFTAAVDTIAELIRDAIKKNVNLQSADLQFADLQFANLRSANLQSANLQSANLQYADLRSANLPSPTVILLADWGNVSE